MTKKDYIVIAKCLKLALESGANEVDIHVIVGIFIGELLKDNSRFDSDKFVAYIFGK